MRARTAAGEESDIEVKALDRVAVADHALRAS